MKVKRMWPAGTLVVEKGAEASPYALRMVVGHKADGRCMTVYVTPPPWLTPEQQHQIFLGGEVQLTDFEGSCAQPKAPEEVTPRAPRDKGPERLDQDRRRAGRPVSERLRAWFGGGAGAPSPRSKPVSASRREGSDALGA